MGGVTSGVSQLQCAGYCCGSQQDESINDVHVSICETVGIVEDSTTTSTSASSQKRKVAFLVADAETEDRAGEMTATLSFPSTLRSQSYALINKATKDSDLAASVSSTSSAALGTELSNRSEKTLEQMLGNGCDAEEIEEAKNKLLLQVEMLVDQAYDVVSAEQMMVQIEKLISPERFREEVMTTQLFERLARKLDFFFHVGVACSVNQSTWMEVYRGDEGRQLITGLLDPTDSSVLHYAVRVEFPTSIINVMAIANETKLLPKWNTLVLKEPDIIGRRTAHYFVLNYQMSAAGGMYKGDVLNEIRRFTDIDNGIMVEYVTSVAQDHPSYHAPEKGFKRMDTVLKNVFLACGPKHTVLIQMGRLKLPFSVTAWIAKLLGGIAGKAIVGGLVKNSLQADVPGNPWESLIEQDKYGLYRRLGLLAKSEGSLSRDPANNADGKVPPFDLPSMFKKHRFFNEEERQLPRTPAPSSVAATTL